MRILGIDPGSRITGYGVISMEKGASQIIEYGILRLEANKSHEYRLKQIYSRLSQVIERCLPDESAIEMPVYGKNPQSMLKLGRAQAACMLAVLNRDIPVTQYTPKEVKRAVTGNGNAAKEQVAFMVTAILKIKTKNVSIDLDASDALAVALCHAQRGKEILKGKTRSSDWASFIRDHPERVK